MSKSTATVIVALTFGVLIAVAFLGNKPGSKYKKVWASSLASTLLAFAADVVPELVGPFALLILIVAVSKNTGLFSKTAAQAGITAPGAPQAQAAASSIAPGGSLF